MYKDNLLVSNFLDYEEDETTEPTHHGDLEPGESSSSRINDKSQKGTNTHFHKF